MASIKPSNKPSGDLSDNPSDNASNNPITGHNEHENIRELRALIKLMSLECERERVCNPDVWPRATIMTPHLMAVLSEYDIIWDDLPDTVLYYKTYVQEQYKEWLVYQTPQVQEALQFLHWPSKGFIILSVIQRIKSFHETHKRLLSLVRKCCEGTIRRPAVTDKEVQDATTWFKQVRRGHEDWLPDHKGRVSWRGKFLNSSEAEPRRVLLSEPFTAVVEVLSRCDDSGSDYERNVPPNDQLQHEDWRNREEKLQSQAKLVPRGKTSAHSVLRGPNRRKQPCQRPGPMTTAEYPSVPPRQPVYYVGFDPPKFAESSATAPARPTSAARSRTKSVAPSSLAINDRASNDTSSHDVDRAQKNTCAPLRTTESTSGQFDGHPRPLRSFIQKVASSQENPLQPSSGNDADSQHTSHERKESHVRDLEAKLNALKNYTDSLQSDNDHLKQALQRARTENEILRSTQITGSQEKTFMDYIIALKHSDDQEILFWLKVARGQFPQEHTSRPTESSVSTSLTSPARPIASPEGSDMYRRFADDSEMSELSV